MELTEDLEREIETDIIKLQAMKQLIKSDRIAAELNIGGLKYYFENISNLRGALNNELVQLKRKLTNERKDN